jgi:hypothetical protein
MRAKRRIFLNVSKEAAMERIGDEVHLTEQEACGAEQYNIGRWVLGLSLFLVVGLLSAIWIIGSITR